MVQKGVSSFKKMSERLNSAMEKLETLEALVDKVPEYADLAPYLRIAVASLRTAVGLYGVPLNMSLNSSKQKDDEEPLRSES